MKLLTPEQIKKHILAIDKKVAVQAIEANDHIRLLFTADDGINNRRVLIYPLGEYPWTNYRVETSSIFMWGDAEIIDKDLTDDLASWLTTFIKAGVFTIPDTTPSLPHPLPRVEQVTDAPQTKLNYKIKKTKDNLLIIVTDGLQVNSLLSSKKELEQAIQNSLAHKWLVERATNKKKLAISHSNQLPTTDSRDFLLTAFYTAVKVVVENLREIEELSISDAIDAGNSLINGQKVISNSFVIHEQIKDALRYRTLAGIN